MVEIGDLSLLLQLFAAMAAATRLWEFMVKTFKKKSLFPTWKTEA